MRFMSILPKEAECVLEDLDDELVRTYGRPSVGGTDRRTTLDTIIQPVGAVLVSVQGNRRSLAASYVRAFNDCDFEVLWMLSKSCGT